jgi:hypothetical protein
MDDATKSDTRPSSIASALRYSLIDYHSCDDVRARYNVGYEPD